MPPPGLRHVHGQGTFVAGPVVSPHGFSVALEFGSASHPYSSRSIVQVGPSFLVHGTGLHYELTIRDADLGVLRRIRWPDWSGPIPEEEIQRLRAAREQSLREAEGRLPAEAIARSRSLADATYDPDILPTLRPALAWRSYVDEQSRVWLAAFEPGAGAT